MSFNIKTTLKLKGHNSTYEWANISTSTAAALQGALLSVLVEAQHATVAEIAGVKSASTMPKTETVKMDVRITQDSKPYFSLSVDFEEMGSDEVQAVLSALSAAVAPFKPTAQKSKH